MNSANSLPPLKLRKLYSEPTVIILGAGASVDYGFPLWGELKDLFLDDIENSKKWKKLLNKYKNSTIDKIVSHASDRQIEDFQLFIYYEFIARERLFREGSISKNKRWIRKFSNKSFKLKHEIILNMFRNLTIVNFNYDRVFAYEFSKSALKFFEKNTPNSYFSQSNFGISRNKIKKLRLKIIHPHGVLGDLNMPHIDIVGYGADKQNGFGLYSSSTYEQSRSILPIDLIDYASNKDAYEMANDVLVRAKNILIIGLSPTALEESKLAKFSDAQNIYYTGSQKLSKNCCTLSLNSTELVNLL